MGEGGGGGGGEGSGEGGGEGGGGVKGGTRLQPGSVGKKRKGVGKGKEEETKKKWSKRQNKEVDGEVLAQEESAARAWDRREDFLIIASSITLGDSTRAIESTAENLRISPALLRTRLAGRCRLTQA